MGYDYLESLLEDNWFEGTKNDDPAFDRQYRVPKPTIDIEKDRKKVRLRNQDHVNIVDGGDVPFEALGVGYHHESATVTFNIEVRTTMEPPNPPDTERPGRTRFDGTYDDGYAGLYGEIKRILDLVRKGGGGYDIIQKSAWRDSSGTIGINHYYGMWIVDFDVRAQEIDPPDPTNING